MIIRKSTVTLILVVGLIYIALGDTLLPAPFGTPSAQLRNRINQALIGAFPDWEPKTNPHQRTEEAIQEQSD
jgi:hypothetical protein